MMALSTQLLNRPCFNRVLIYGVVSLSMLTWIFPASSHHDGKTVSLLLARLGEGPLGHKDNGAVECDGGLCANQTVQTADSDGVVENMCWGYEKGCKKENRLFVPRCDGPSKPWYINLCLF